MYSRFPKRNSGKTDAKAMMYADFFDEPPLQTLMASKKSVKSKRKNESGYVDVGYEESNDVVGIEEEVANAAEDMMENDDDYEDCDSSDGNELASSNESQADLSEQSHLPENISSKLDEKSSTRSRFEKESLKVCVFYLFLFYEFYLILHKIFCKIHHDSENMKYFVFPKILNIFLQF